ncbi:MAG TPA: replication-associated recombination protein A [bacterium]|nr:replication-associated recombination protein A [bacterium]
MDSPSLFASEPHEPLAARMRPRTLEEFVGQEHLLGPGKPLRRAIESDRIGSMIFWGPPGSGKTTLARLISKTTGADFILFSAVLSGVKEVRAAVERAEKRRAFDGGRTILFVDEIHRFNKAQQDAFLPHVETGTLILIGATTENPSFEVNSALLSRMTVYILHPLTDENLARILRSALTDAERGLGAQGIAADDEVLMLMAALCNGDARRALTLLETAAADLESKSREGDAPAEPVSSRGAASNAGSAEASPSRFASPLPRAITAELIRDIVQRKTELYDKSGEEHFNIISALHKSLRGSDPDAALYWLYRMLEGGEDPLYIARRLVRFAVEDIGLADPRALTIALAAKDTYHFLGSPEGELALAEAVVYMAVAPKSNAVYMAEKAVKRAIGENPSAPVPLWIRNAVTTLMKRVGYGKGYLYAHDFDGGIVDQHYLPDRLEGTRFYRPTDRGLEERIAQRLAEIAALKERFRKEHPPAEDTPAE